MVVARTAPWEDPVERFMKGYGEALDEQGRCFTLWEAIVHFDMSQYPLNLNGTDFSKEDLLQAAYMALSGDVSWQTRGYLSGGTGDAVIRELEIAGYGTSDLAWPPDDQEQE